MNSELGLDTGNSTADYIGIRAQSRNPINRKLPRLKTQVAGASGEIWVAYASLYFSFLLFSFIFLFFFFSVVVFLEQIISARFFYFIFFLGSECYR